MREIILSNGAIALVDDEDYERVAALRWSQLPHGYAKSHLVSRVDGRRVDKGIYMHRLVLDAKPGQQVDHINHDRLDNRRCNLRFCNFSQNQANRSPQWPHRRSSKYKGVSRAPRAWIAGISAGGHTRHIGSFLSEEDAARAYDAAAREAYGEYAVLNFPDEPSLPAEELAARRKPGKGKYARLTQSRR